MRTSWAKSWIVLRNVGITMLFAGVLFWVLGDHGAAAWIAGLCFWLVGCVLVLASWVALVNEGSGRLNREQNGAKHPSAA